MELRRRRRRPSVGLEGCAESALPNMLAPDAAEEAERLEDARLLLELLGSMDMRRQRVLLLRGAWGLAPNRGVRATRHHPADLSRGTRAGAERDPGQSQRVDRRIAEALHVVRSDGRQRGFSRWPPTRTFPRPPPGRARPCKTPRCPYGRRIAQLGGNAARDRASSGPLGRCDDCDYGSTRSSERSRCRGADRGMPA